MMHIPFDAPVDRRKFLAQAALGFGIGIGALITSGCSDDAPKERFTLTA